MSDEKIQLPTIIFTGGHHNSALTIARELFEQKKALVVWYGHKYSMFGDLSLSAEYQEVTKSSIPFREVKAGKLYKTFHPLHWLRLPFGFFQAFWYLLRDRPDLVVSFGGYLATPVVLAAWIQRIPSVTHVQTTVVGLANRFIGFFATKVFVTWPQSKRYFDQNKVTITGLPLRPELFQTDSVPMFTNDLPILYVTGGKQGSHIINETIQKSLESLLLKVNIVHQTGGSTVFNDYDTAIKHKQMLSKQLQSRYRVEKYIYEEEIGSVFSQASIVLSRAGGHTVYEVAALAKPAIFVPIPWVSHNEQHKNARMLVNEGAALLLAEDRLSPETLEKTLDTMLSKYQQFYNQAKVAKSRVIFNAKERIVNEITTMVSATETSK